MPRRKTAPEPVQAQATVPSIDVAEIVHSVVSQLSEKLGNGGTKLDERLSEINQAQHDSREESIRLGAKLEEVGRAVGEIKPSISALGTRIQEVERNVGKPCPFHDLTVRQVEGVAGLQKQCAATDLKLAELSQKHVGLTDMHTATTTRIGLDIAGIQSSIGSLGAQVNGLTAAVTTLKDTGGETKDWVKYIIISVMTVVFTVLTVKLVDWISPHQHASSAEKVEAVASK